MHTYHSSATEKKISPSDISGLEPGVFLAKGAKVMLTMNFWASVGLYNGATGTIIDYIYQVEQQPPQLPEAVNDYNSPSIITFICSSMSCNCLCSYL